MNFENVVFTSQSNGASEILDENFIINDSNDGFPSAGESFGLSIPLLNIGTQTLSGVQASLSSMSEHVILSGETISYGKEWGNLLRSTSATKR